MRFSHIEKAPADPILKLTPLYLKDQNPKKLNLGVGTYRTAQGHPFLFSSVRQAEKQIVEEGRNKEYLPIEGDSEFLQSCLSLLFSASEQKQCVSLQTFGGSGALRIGADFLALAGVQTLYLSNPTWANHKNLLGNRLRIEAYPYYTQKTFTFEQENFLNALQNAPSGSALLLHGCCHNPTGIDPSFSLWKEIASITKEKNLIPFFDLAYHGFCRSLEEDHLFLRPFLESGQAFLLAYSFSKNMGLYGERIGHLTVFSDDPAYQEAILSQLRQLVRKDYSSPAISGERLVNKVLQTPSLCALWKEELAQVKNRIENMRKLLADALCKEFSPLYESLRKQTGLFTLLPLSKEQVEQLQHQFSIYMPSSGRINIAGLNESTIPYLIDALKQVIHEPKKILR